jgi:hypothetical protein
MDPRALMVSVWLWGTEYISEAKQTERVSPSPEDGRAW